jgi:hypothetical protein
MSEWVSILLRWECAFAKPGLPHSRSSGAPGDGGSEYTPINSSSIAWGKAVVRGQQGFRCGGRRSTAKGSRRTPLRGLRALAASDYGADVRVGLRHCRRPPCDSSLETGMDGQSSSNGVPGIANVRFQRICPRGVQRAWDTGYLDRIFGSFAIPRGKAPLKSSKFRPGGLHLFHTPRTIKFHGIHGKTASL